jgi:hypothetical protein
MKRFVSFVHAVDMSLRFLVTVSALLLLANFGSCAMASQEFKHPPLGPGSDELGSDNEPFVQRCHAHAKHMITSMKLEVIQEMVTQSKEWGPVWRADFNFPKQKPSSIVKVNRMMCWEQGEKLFFMSSVAQPIVPLLSMPEKSR